MAVADGASAEERGSWLIIYARAIEWDSGSNLDNVAHLTDVEQMSR